MTLYKDGIGAGLYFDGKPRRMEAVRAGSYLKIIFPVRIAVPPPTKKSVTFEKGKPIDPRVVTRGDLRDVMKEIEEMEGFIKHVVFSNVIRIYISQDKKRDEKIADKMAWSIGEEQIALVKKL
jgi:hypothetical protein